MSYAPAYPMIRLVHVIFLRPSEGDVVKKKRVCLYCVAGNNAWS